MSLNEAYKVRSRWPVAFDIEGVPRDTQTRNQKLFSIEENDMQISNVRSKGTFNYNTPENTRYEHQEFPRAVYRAETFKKVETQDELDHALAKGWFLTKAEAHEAIGIGSAPAAGKSKGKASQVIPEIPDEDEDDDVEHDVKHSKLPVGEATSEAKPAKAKKAKTKKK